MVGRISTLPLVEPASVYVLLSQKYLIAPITETFLHLHHVDICLTWFHRWKYPLSFLQEFQITSQYPMIYLFLQLCPRHLQYGLTWLLILLLL